MITRFTNATELPEVWDTLCTSLFQQRSFLIHCEMYNPCRQRYYLLYKDEVPICGAIVYTHRQDLFTYLSLRSPVRMQIVGVPCSVASPGIIGNMSHSKTVISHILKSERGLHLVLNLYTPLDSTLKDWAHGTTLPTVVLNNGFNNWDEYFAALRAPYRRRLKKIVRYCSQCTWQNITCSSFTSTLYSQYEAVFSKSSAKLEKLSMMFFKNLPDNFNLTIIEHDHVQCGWFITVGSRDTLFFFLGGMDYSINETSDLYFSMLLFIVRCGIEQGYKKIDLGQTAETAKARFGGTIKPCYMAGHHSHPLLNTLIKKTAPLLSYRKRVHQPAVFRSDV